MDNKEHCDFEKLRDMLIRSVWCFHALRLLICRCKYRTFYIYIYMCVCVCVCVVWMSALPLFFNRNGYIYIFIQSCTHTYLDIHMKHTRASRLHACTQACFLARTHTCFVLCTRQHSHSRHEGCYKWSSLRILAARDCAFIVDSKAFYFRWIGHARGLFLARDMLTPNE